MRTFLFFCGYFALCFVLLGVNLYALWAFSPWLVASNLVFYAVVSYAVWTPEWLQRRRAARPESSRLNIVRPYREFSATRGLSDDDTPF